MNRLPFLGLLFAMMFSSGVGAVVQILQYLSKEESLKAFVIWTMGALGEMCIRDSEREHRLVYGRCADIQLIRFCQGLRTRHVIHRGFPGYLSLAYPSDVEWYAH